MAIRSRRKKAGRRKRLSRETLLQKLTRAKLNFATLVFQDGRSLDGTVIFNEIKGTGRLINANKEYSIDFRLDDLKDVRG